MVACVCGGDTGYCVQVGESCGATVRGRVARAFRGLWCARGMTRPRRHEHGSRPLHLIARGVEEGVLFPDPVAHQIFWNEFGRQSLELGITIGHVCLMTTHYHLLVRGPRDALAEGLMHAHRKVAVYNNRAGRRGRVFGRRYQVLPIDTSRHLRAVARYLPMNPVKAGMVRNPADWKWSTHRFLAGQDEAPPWYDVKAALRMVAFFDGRSYERWVLRDTPLEMPPMTPREVIDHRIRVMADYGLTDERIAKDLGVTLRRVREVVAGAVLSWPRPVQDPDIA